MKIILETERLIIREALPKDAVFFLKVMNTEGWLANIGDRGMRTIEDTQKHIEVLHDEYKKNGYGYYVMDIKSDRATVGTVGIMKRDHLEHIDIGYALLPEYEGNGYATEGARALLHYAMQVLNLSPICAVTSFTNYASHKILERIGLHKIGTTTWPNGDELFLFST